MSVLALAADERAPRARALPAWLAHARLPVVAAALTVLFSTPAFLVPAVVDDLYHDAVLRPEGPVDDAASALGAFAFVDGDAARTARLRDRGVLPWWLGEHTRFAFFRPLAELTHRIDRWLPFGRTGMHAQDLGWAFALVLAVAHLYRRLLGAGPLAGLAALAYALDDAHGLPFGWTANRNAVMAACFGVLAIHAYDRGVKEGRFRVLAPVLFAFSLASAEAGIATLAFMAAHVLVLDPRPLRARLASLAPPLLLLVAWRVGTSTLGYGVRGSGLYVDPLHDPVRFAEAALFRVPVLLSGQLGPVPSDVDGLFDEPTRPVLALLSASFVAGLALLAWPAIGGDRRMRFFALGMLGSTLPVAATFPSDRLLFFVGVGAMPLVARVIELAFTDGRLRALGVLLVLVHLGLAPLLLPARAWSPAWVAAYLEPCSAPLEAVSSGSAERELVMLNALDVCPVYLPVRAALEGRTAPPSFTVAPGGAEVTVVRVDARTLRVARAGGWFSTTAERAFWDPDAPLAVGEERPLGRGLITVREMTDDGRPLAVDLGYDVPLDDAAVFMAIEPDGTRRPVVLPAVGEALVLVP